MVVGIYPEEQSCGDGVRGVGMGVNGWGVRGTGIIWRSGSNLGSGVGEGITTVDASITWDKTPPTTYPPSSVRGEIVRPGVLVIGCATTTLNSPSFKGSGAGASKNWTETVYVTVVSPVVAVVAAAALPPPSPPVEGQWGLVVWSLTLWMLIVATFVAPLPGSNLVTKKVLCLPNAVAFGPISTSRTVPTRIMVFLFAP